MFLLMEGLRARGHENVLAGVPGGAPGIAARERGFEVVEVPMRNDLDWPAVGRLRAAIEAERIDLVHLHTGRANWLGGWAARRAGRPAITTRRMDRRVKRGWRTRLIYGRLVRRVAAISPAVLRCLHEGGVPEAMTRLVWSSVDPASLAPTRSRDEVRAALEVPGSAPFVLAAGALVERKGFDVLVDAFALLQVAGAILWIAGEGDPAALKKRVERHGLAGRVRLLGRRNDVPDLLAAADVFAMPSRAEGLGIAALEAMAAGLPVVASRVGGLGEVVLDGETGRLVPPGDAAALARALDEVLGDATLRVRLGAAGRARVQAEFTADRMVDAYEALYREVLAEVDP